jgi:hypothetical protein
VTRPLLALLALCVGIALVACGGEPPSPELVTPSNPRLSPSGSYRLVVTELHDRGPAWRFRIESPAGATLFDSPDRFAIRHRTVVLWGPADRVWVYSGDLGLFYWERTGDTWVKHVHMQGDALPLPPALTAAVPRL